MCSKTSLGHSPIINGVFRLTKDFKLKGNKQTRLCEIESLVNMTDRKWEFFKEYSSFAEILLLKTQRNSAINDD